MDRPNWLAVRAAGEEALGDTDRHQRYRGGRGDRLDASDLLMAGIREAEGPEIVLSENVDEQSGNDRAASR